MTAATVRRGKIGAEFGAPAPKYPLPGLCGSKGHDFRSVHREQPSYSFGTKRGKLVDDASPGPCYMPEPKIYRDGKDGTPHFSLHERYREMTQFKTPAPGAYKPEEAGPTAHYRHAAYSFGSRTRQRAADQNPGPNQYTLPSVLGETKQARFRQAPMYSMRCKPDVGGFTKDLAKTPGPGTYNACNPDTVKTKRPLYSMTSRNPMPGDNCLKPGPGAHSPEKVYVTKKEAPKISFGQRHSVYICPLIVDPVN